MTNIVTTTTPYEPTPYEKKKLSLKTIAAISLLIIALSLLLGTIGYFIALNKDPVYNVKTVTFKADTGSTVKIPCVVVEKLGNVSIDCVSEAAAYFPATKP